MSYRRILLLILLCLAIYLSFVYFVIPAHEPESRNNTWMSPFGDQRPYQVRHDTATLISTQHIQTTPIPVPTTPPLPPQVSASDIANGLVWLEIPAINLFSRLDLAIEIDSANGPTFTEPAENPLLIPNWSADIGLPGVSIIYGHRQWGPSPKVFTDLDNLIVGDQANITSPGYRFTYKVIETLIINPADLWTVAGNHDLVAKSNNRNYLMLITCTPWGTNLQRLIIFLQLEAVT